MIYSGDCLDLLALLPDDSVDSVVTDPPYGLSDHRPADVVACLTAWLAGEEYRPNKRGFMGRTWDSWVPGPEVWREVYRVLKPGGHVVAFAGSRTHDLMSMAMRLAAFECRDTVMWVYGSGFPKSLDVSKAIDKALGVDGTFGAPKSAAHAGWIDRGRMRGDGGHEGYQRPWMADENAVDRNARQYIGGSEESRQWAGWGTALKPAFEPALLFRKPLAGTVAENVLAHRTGALNIDGCRVGDRFPANLIHDGSDEVLALFPDSAGSGGSVPNVKVTGYGDGIGTGQSAYLGGERRKVAAGSGSAARFFYCPKASRADRDAGTETLEKRKGGMVSNTSGQHMTRRDGYEPPAVGNHHPTVKPTDLMAYLCRLVTPPGGLVLDPFAGSGSTGVGAVRGGFRFIGFEREPEYTEIARRRIQNAG